MLKKASFSKKIIKILSEKPAISVEELTERVLPLDKGEMSERQRGSDPSSILPLSRGGGIQSKYAITRSIKGLEEAGLIEHISSGQNYYARLTKDGRKKATSIKLEAEDSLVSTTWDGYWRIILLDLPESRKNERESLRYLLKKAGFICLKNSAWISPYPFEHMFTNIKKDLGLTTEMMIIVTDKLDKETEDFFYSSFK